MTQAVAKIESGAVASPAASVLEVIARAAKDPGVDIDKLERLMAMQERLLAKQAEEAFALAMQAAQREMPIIAKDAVNPSTNSRYTRLESLYKQVVPIVTKHGFSISFGTSDCPLPAHFRVTAKVMHQGGHSEKYQADIPSDHLGPKGSPSKTLVHGFGSSMSYGRRYLTMLIFNVATGEDVDGNQGSAQSATALRKQLWELLRNVRGPAKDWSGANQWCWDELGMDPEKQIQTLDAAGLSELIDQAKAKLEGA